MTLFDQLGIDEDAAIDPTEVAKIKRTLEQAKGILAGVAKTNDTQDTIAILDLLVPGLLKPLAKRSLPELQQFITGATGAVPQQQPNALGGASAPTAAAPAAGSAASNSTSALEQRIKEYETAFSGIAQAAGLSGVALLPGGGVDTKALTIAIDKAFKDKGTAAVPPASVEKTKIKTEVDKAKAALATLRKSGAWGSTDQVLTDADAKAAKSAVDELAKLAS